MTTDDLRMADAASVVLGERVMLMWQSDSDGLWYMCPHDVRLDIIKGPTPAEAVESARRRWAEQRREA